MSTTITLTFKGEDSWNRPVFKGDNGRLYKSVELFSLDTPPDLTELYDCDNDFEGEPGYPPKDTTFELVGQHPWLQQVTPPCPPPGDPCSGRLFVSERSAVW